MICFFIYKQDCKPGYVFQMIIYLEQLLPAASSNLPKTNGPHYRLASVLLQMGFTCAPSVTREAVVSYTAFPPLRQISTAETGDAKRYRLRGIRRIPARQKAYPCKQAYGKTFCQTSCTAHC